jgi:hypothetical protein
MNYTPGPWSTDDKMGGIWGPDGKPIMTCGQHAVDFGEGTIEARDNAFLIAAAPDQNRALVDLLELYVSLVNSGDCGNWDPEKEPEVIAARAAIAKAEGKS